MSYKLKKKESRKKTDSIRGYALRRGALQSERDSLGGDK
ncbi:hypothetical protein C943_04228 [Mariniradius saccharolyticus AK6]|uniref:Uncharacterized protein n=1 Tax=Mariniradius saccharolyticus AK6 TaxID=1239962 RepID=M7XGH4_9BACT|nr:hypothetical protein C943_04228 [Mariniradius saccharolyticus AK6]